MAPHVVCREFQQGRCSYGDRCRFLHENSAPSDKRNAPGISSPSNYAALVRWRYDIPDTPPKIKQARPLHQRFSRFIKTALHLVAAETETMQEIITLLASEGGLARLGEMLDTDMDAMTEKNLELLWRDQLLPLLELLAHDSVLSSGIIETQYATILNYTYSINGKRALAVFRSALRCLRLDNEVPVAVEPVVVVLAEMFEAIPSAQVNDDLRALAEAISALADKRTLSGRPYTQNIRLRRRLGLGAAIEQVDGTKHTKKAALRPSFTVAVDQPGFLSKLGPRHDNDSEDIDDIQILPTMAEIISERAEYLPQDDPSLWHKSGVQGLLDRQFRLIREDTVGQLRDAIQTGLERLHQTEARPMKPRNSTHTNTYHDVHLAAVEFDTHKGLLCVLAFEHPRMIRDWSNKKRQEWWTETRRLEHDALLGLVGSDGTVVFVTVHAPMISQSWRNSKDEQRPIDEKYSRWRGKEAYVIVQLVDRTNEHDIEDLLLRFGHQAGAMVEHRFSLIEFPKILLAAFKPTLEALRRTARSGFLPFSTLVAPENGTASADVGLPAYARAADFRYDLSVLSKSDEIIKFDPHDAMTAEELASKTSLDHGQAQAMIASLTKELALVQGPPGTGKSYTGVALIKALLANRAAANMGPIVIVTYTNHALGQTLEHLVAAGVEQMIRIGGQSKNESLASINIRVVADKYPPTKAESKSRKIASAEMRDLAPMITSSLEQYSRSVTAEGVMAYLKDHHGAFHSQLCPEVVDEEGFQAVNHQPKGVQAWLRGTAIGAYDPDNVFTWDPLQRYEALGEWSRDRSMDAKIDLLASLQAHGVAKARHEQTKGEITLRALNDAHIIGVTTTGLAQNLQILSRLNAKVLIVEEAGEVLEAHLLTALLPSIEHAILIGDHKELRPKVANYAFDCENPNPVVKLNISLLERLILPQQPEVTPLPHVTLNVQRRMHPSIARLVRETVYPDLQDDSCVGVYPEVSGMRRRLFWLEHSELEDGQQSPSIASAPPGSVAGPATANDLAADSTTHTNEHEVNMVLALVRHLIRQGVYRPSDIAVLTPYLGQLRKIRKALANFTEVVLNDLDETDLKQDGDEDNDSDIPTRPTIVKSTLLKAVRLATVDNFQGEEAKVVIISLVRSNFMRKPGFLSQPNRANVLLSRAQHGMYIIGNPETFTGSEVWRDVITMLDQDGNIGPSFELCCPRHPDAVLAARTPDDFAIISPEAGCGQVCGRELSCGHSSTGRCHADGLHNATYCTAPCTEPMDGCKHTCSRECGADCDEKCEVMVTDIDVELPCGHHATALPCHETKNQNLITCQVTVERTSPGCGHVVAVPCDEDVDDPAYECPSTCGTVFPCGHVCTASCAKCSPHTNGGMKQADHNTCTTPCGKKYNTCPHTCPQICHADTECEPCQSPCDVSCSHGQCLKPCSEPCAPCCEDKCASRCQHSRCSMPCAAPCDWIPCSKRCERKLGCGHQCPTICGVLCPSEKACQICTTDEIKNMRADLQDMTKYGDVDLDLNPCIFTGCTHVFTVRSLDSVMGMSAYYELESKTGMPVALEADSVPFSTKETQGCPDCHKSLHSLTRYGRITRRAQLDESTKRLVLQSEQSFHELTHTLQEVQAGLLETREDASLGDDSVLILGHGDGRYKLLTRLKSTRRYQDLAELRRQAREFWVQASKDELPFERVCNMAETVRRKRALHSNVVNGSKLDGMVLQTRGELQASALILRCDVIAMTDLVSVWCNDKTSALYVNFAADRRACETLIELAKTTKHPIYEIQGHIFWATFAALECQAPQVEGSISQNALQTLRDVGVRTARTNGTAHAETANVKLRDAAEEHLDRAQELYEQHPDQTDCFSDEIDDARLMVNVPDFQSTTPMAVVATGHDVRGAGSWCACVNGHPTAVAADGRSSQPARCPQCNESIIGHHRGLENGA